MKNTVDLWHVSTNGRLLGTWGLCNTLFNILTAFNPPSKVLIHKLHVAYHPLQFSSEPLFLHLPHMDEIIVQKLTPLAPKFISVKHDLL